MRRISASLVFDLFIISVLYTYSIQERAIHLLNPGALAYVDLGHFGVDGSLDHALERVFKPDTA